MMYNLAIDRDNGKKMYNYNGKAHFVFLEKQQEMKMHKILKFLKRGKLHKGGKHTLEHSLC